MTCKLCIMFKLRWKDGSGQCFEWHEPKHAEADICPEFKPKVIVSPPSA